MNRNTLMPIMISMTRYYYNSKPYIRTISVLFSDSRILFTAFFLASALIFFSCEENPTIIGTGNLPGKDFVSINSNDTIEVGVYTQYIDSSKTNGRTYSYLGNLYDPYFGATSADFVSQLRLTKKWPGGGAFTIDSVKLYFTIAGARGTLDSTIHKIKISEIGEILNSAASYYSDRDPNSITDLGTYDLPVIGKDTVTNLKVPLPVSIGEYLMRDTTKLTQEDDANDFRSFFRGIYVTFEPSPKPFLMALQFSSGEFYIRVFYHNNNATNLSYDFIINPNSVRYNRYFHDFAAAPPETRINHINDGIKDTLSYLQGFEGVFPAIKMPSLKTFRSMMPISVNKAKLTFTVFLDDSLYTTNTLPSQIFLSYTAADSLKYIVSDYIISPSFFDGTFNSTTKTYTFNIASFVQQYLDTVNKIAQPELEMYFPDGEFKNVILKTNSSSSPVKFEFTYTKF